MAGILADTAYKPQNNLPLSLPLSLSLSLSHGMNQGVVREKNCVELVI